MSGEERRCRRCGDEEFRIDGYCTEYCKDLHEVEQERDETLRLLASIVSEQREMVLLCEKEWDELMNEARKTIKRIKNGAKGER